MLSMSTQYVDREQPDFRTKILARIEARGLTYREVSDAVGLHTSNISNWATGKCGLRYETLERLCGFLQLELKPARRRRTNGKGRR